MLRVASRLQRSITKDSLFSAPVSPDIGLTLPHTDTKDLLRPTKVVLCNTKSPFPRLLHSRASKYATLHSSIHLGRQSLLMTPLSANLLPLEMTITALNTPQRSTTTNPTILESAVTQILPYFLYARGYIVLSTLSSRGVLYNMPSAPTVKYAKTPLITHSLQRRPSPQRV